MNEGVNVSQSAMPSIHPIRASASVGVGACAVRVPRNNNAKHANERQSRVLFMRVCVCRAAQGQAAIIARGLARDLRSVGQGAFLAKLRWSHLLVWSNCLYSLGQT